MCVRRKQNDRIVNLIELYSLIYLAAFAIVVEQLRALFLLQQNVIIFFLFWCVYVTITSLFDGLY